MGEVCIANIGGPQRGARLGFGLVMAAVTLVVAGVLIVTGAPRLARVVVAPLAWMSAIGLLQFTGRT
jgi:hypothetical protein